LTPVNYFWSKRGERITTNTVVATVPVVPVGNGPTAVAVTPDGKHVYVTGANNVDNVSVIDTATNNLVATVTVASTPLGVGIISPPPGVNFLAFSAKLAIQFSAVTEVAPLSPPMVRVAYTVFTVPVRLAPSNEPDSIGKAVSSGCIRMMNADAIDLYQRVKIGTRVVVL
jgi:YVTN family beta-propeller protein